MTKPLDGYRIIDFSRVIAGPYCTQQLAFLGADVVRIEDPAGDDMRRSSANRELAERGHSPMFFAINAGKRAICLDLKRPEATPIVHALVRGADAVVENFRPGVMKRLGFDWPSLRAINPGLVYCSISGFGQTGPDAGSPAYDGKIQATSGIMSITGHPETGPTRAGFAVADSTTGMCAALAVTSALLQRTRTGIGQYIDVAMLDSVLSFMSSSISDVVNGGVEPQLYGNMAISGKPTTDMFPVRGGNIQLSCNTEGQYTALCREIGREDLLTDPRFTDWSKRIDNFQALRGELIEAFASDDAPGWERRLNAAGVPAASIRTLREAISHVQPVHRGLLREMPAPAGMEGTVKIVGSPFLFEHDGPGTDLPSPALDEHTDAVLAEIGLDAREIAGLRAAGVVGAKAA